MTFLGWRLALVALLAPSPRVYDFSLIVVFDDRLIKIKERKANALAALVEQIMVGQA